MKNETNTRLAMKVSWVTIIINILLSAFKLGAGIIAHSGAMLSDAVHSASDVFSTVIVIIGVKIAEKGSDSDHPYGHERMECVAALLLSALLFVTGIGIGISGIRKIIAAEHQKLIIPGTLALIAAILSILIKEGMYWYTRNAAKQIHSSALMADAWHHRSDAFSSAGSFAGIYGARLGFPILDPLASVIICIFIAKAAIDIFRDAIGKMTDKSWDEKTIAEIRTMVLSETGVLGIDQLKTRLFGDKVYVDIEILADGNLTLTASHDIAHRVHDAIEDHFPRVKHCMVHVNPFHFISQVKES